MLGARKTLTLVFSIITLFLAAYGVYGALHSPLFWIQVVEVNDQPEDAPLDAQEVVQLASVPVGNLSLVDLNLPLIEKRLLQNPWVAEARLTKRFPQTLAISLNYRQPRALIQGRGGKLRYVDSGGEVFGEVSLKAQPDLPVLFGISERAESSDSESATVADALRILDYFAKPDLVAVSQISSLSWSPEEGFRAWVTYPYRAGGGDVTKTARAVVHLGQRIDDEGDAQFERLKKVFDYLARHPVPARQIYAEASKKIVVKTARGS